MTIDDLHDDDWDDDFIEAYSDLNIKEAQNAALKDMHIEPEISQPTPTLKKTATNKDAFSPNIMRGDSSNNSSMDSKWDKYKL